MISKLMLAWTLKQANEHIENLEKRNKLLEETLRTTYIALKKHENLDVDIVGEAMGILEERAWGE